MATTLPVIISVFLFAALVGGLLGIGAWQISAPLVLIPIIPIFYRLASRVKNESKDIWFWVIFSLIPISSIIFSTTGTKISYVLELIVFASVPLTIWQLKYWFEMSFVLRLILLLLVCYFIIAIISSVIGESTPLAFAYQTITNLKFFFLLMLGTYISWSEKSERVLVLIIRWAWAPLLIMVVIQLATPSLFQSVYPFAVHDARNDLFGIQKAVGIFRHPSYLGLYSALLMLYAIVIAIVKNRSKYFLVAAMYLPLLLASGERHEIMTGVVLAILALAISRSNKTIKLRLFFGSLLALIVGVLIVIGFSDYFYSLAKKMSLIGLGTATQPRSVLYADSLKIAEQYFPFGSGLGTFASAAAAKFNRTIYDDMGYRSFGWYDDNVLSDTYWPQYLAETGVFGLILMASVFFVLIITALQRTIKTNVPETRFYWVMSLIGILLVTSVSLASPIIEDPGLFLLPATMLAVAIRKEIDYQMEKKLPSKSCQEKLCD